MPQSTGARVLGMPVTIGKGVACIDGGLEEELRAFEEAERGRLGLKEARPQWSDGMLKPELKKREKDHVTLLISGLTAAQDFLIEGALKGLGYKIEYFGVSDNEGLRVGKEYGNRGQCNPTYFTVGGLVKHLIELRDRKGLPAEQIIRDYVFVSAGACGPCRFGMYVTEYRKALRDSGFDGFRVLLFQQQGGLSQATGDDVGLALNPAFFVALVKAVVCGDLVNALGYRLRPYELEAGATDRAMEGAKKILYRALQEQQNVLFALYRCRRLFAAVKVDKLRPRAKVSVIGEFWAMTTEGDGNYGLKRFLEQEGGEVETQLTTAWLLYNIWEVARDTRERRDLRGTDGGQYGLGGLGELGVARRLALMRLAEGALRAGFGLFAWPIGLFDYPLADMDEVAGVSQPYYSNDLRGGEGHMEVGKLILNVLHRKAHLTTSVKPFGCMPSSGVSDGVQTVVQARHPGSLFCAVETSGDGATNFYSRVQMVMFKARLAAEKELQQTYRDCGVSEAEVRRFLEAHPRYARVLHHAPHQVAGSAANLVREVAPLIKRSSLERAAGKARAALAAARVALAAVPARARAASAFCRDPATHARLREDLALLRDLARGKVKERLAPLART